MLLPGPQGDCPWPWQTTVNFPSNHSHFSVDVILPPGPISPGFISPSMAQVPTKYPSRWCSGPGFGAAGSWALAKETPSNPTHSVRHLTLLSIRKSPPTVGVLMVSPGWRGGHLGRCAASGASWEA